MKFYIDVTEQGRCKMLDHDNELVDDYTDAISFNTRKEAENHINSLLETYPYLEECASIEIHENWYIFWADGVNSGFVDYSEDFVTDDIEERAMWFETEYEANEYIDKIRTENPNCCNLEAVEYIDE